MTGQSGSFAAGMGYDFPYQQPCDNYIDQIGANGGVIAFRSQDNHGRVVYYSGSGNSYRVIHATCVFGALRNGTHTKAQMMTVYMNYLTQTIGVMEASEAALQTVSLSPNPTYSDITLSFALTQQALVAVEIYNIVGQHVRQVVHQNLDAGTHTLNWDGRDDYGRNVSSGTYILTIRVDDKAISKTVVRLN